MENAFVANFNTANLILQRRDHVYRHASAGGHLYSDGVECWTSVNFITAGMVLAEINPQYHRIQRGLRLASFAKQVEELFPQAETRIGVDARQIEIVVKPCKEKFFKTVQPMFPKWTAKHWAHPEPFMYKFGVYDFTWYEMGAFLWKQG